MGLPVINDLGDFSRFTHLSTKLLFKLSKFSDKYYKTYPIKKNKGGERIISQPSKALKALQSWILHNILNKVNVSEVSKGFEKGSSILDNASPHLNANAILVIDIENFFPSISTQKIYTIFHSLGYNSLISTIFKNICCYNGSLPQGSPCSPKLSNIVCFRLDSRIQGYVNKKGIIYTRYADDLTFSSTHPNRLRTLLPFLEKILKEEGFNLNADKTRVMGNSRAKKVTGLIISDSDVGIGKRAYKKLRAKIFQLSTAENIKNYKLLSHVQGYLSFLKSVDKIRYQRAITYITYLKIKNPKSPLEVLKLSS